MKKSIEELCCDAVKSALGAMELTPGDENRIWTSGQDPHWELAKQIRYSLMALSDYGRFRYSDNYTVRPVEEQIEILRGLGFQIDKFCKPEVKSLYPAEGLFVIPKKTFVPKKCQNPNEYALGFMYERLRDSMDYWSLAREREDDFKETVSKFNRNPPTQWAFDAMDKHDPEADAYVIPAQFGRRHRGNTTEEAYKMFIENEFALGVYEVGCMLLTHPERLKGSGSMLGIICSGDTIGSSEVIVLGHWNFFHNISMSSKSSAEYGAATGFLWFDPPAPTFPV